ncbi:M48 family metallopeptidase [Nitrospinota bacterium]
MYESTYTDGKTAARRPVRVDLTMNRLLIRGEDGSALDEWSLPGLRLAEEIYGRSQPVRLSHRERGESLLSFESQEILGALAESVPGLRGRSSWARRLLTPLAIALAALVFIAAVLAAAFPYAVERLSNYIPREWEDALGSRVMDTIGTQYPSCRGRGGEAALTALVSRLAAARGIPPVEVRVFRSRIPNAFTAPGGHIGIFEGLFRFTETPEEFAGVLAHEMGHAALRHPAKSLVRRAGFALIFSMMTGDASWLTSSAGKLTKSLLNLSFTREAELESDREAIRTLGRAGIRSDGLSRFLARLKRRAPKHAAGGYFSTHPAAGERIAAMRGRTRPGAPAMTPAEWRALRGICSNTGSW